MADNFLEKQYAKYQQRNTVDIEELRLRRLREEYRNKKKKDSTQKK